MASTPSKAKKPRYKPPTSRPANTSSLAHPAAEVTISSAPKRPVAEDEEPVGPPTKRYSEPASVAVRSGIEEGQDATMDDLPDTQGELDVDLAELSLGQRLTAISGDPALNGASSDEEDAEQSAQPPEGPTLRTVPAASLTRTLIQALHSSDSGLLETCLAHTNANLIQNTVRRLPPQLAVPLVTATALIQDAGLGCTSGRSSHNTHSTACAAGQSASSEW
ncbi:hypothetical protein NM688_g8909 [Phlebia brevispora]|uniref:Uncharacterized protein n=1 Tax=Phlebia brevispora TaxID=194682 RepID=A0ACC1RM17_9APHY|nr:hypothetical protein NM688_g8909 [Phlebia brevispora]